MKNPSVKSMERELEAVAARAREAAERLASCSSGQKNAALEAMAAELRRRTGEILAENAADLRDARKKGRPGALLDRLRLDEGRLEGMASALEEVAALPDPGGRGDGHVAPPQRPVGGEDAYSPRGYTPDL